MAAGKQFEILLTNSSTVEKKLPKRMIASYATWSPAIDLAVTGIMAAGICDSLVLLVDQAMDLSKWQERTEVAELSFAATDK